MKRLFILNILLLSAVCSCGSKSADGAGSSTAGLSSTIDSSPFAVSTASTASTYSTADLAANTSFTSVIAINFTANTVQTDSGTEETITSAGITTTQSDNTTVTVATSTYGIAITSTASAAVKYVLSGSLNGTLIVNSTNPYQLYLNGVTISGSSGPALDLESTAKAFIVLADETSNSFSDTSTRSGMTTKAALYGKGSMVYSGSGTLSVTGNYKHGIFCNNYIRICGGTYNINVTAKDAIRSVNGFIFDDGTLTVKGTGTTVDDESKGIKVEGSESTSGAGKGFIVINGGSITINSVSKGITASWDIDEDALTTDTDDDPTPYVIINNGIISVTTTGTPYETTINGTTVSCSPEGIESKTDLTINSGYITVSTADDCLNAGSSITVNGGYFYGKSSANDGIDSNGTMTITDGVIVAIGSSAPEGAIDCDTNTFKITGGTFVGIGGTTSGPTASACIQNAVVRGSSASGTTCALVSSSGTVAFAFTIPQTYATMILSASAITTGTKYTVYTGGTAAGDNLYNGLYLGTLSYTGGTAGTSFTVASRLTQSGGTIFK